MPAVHQFEESLEHFSSSRGDHQPRHSSMLGLDASAGPDDTEDEGRMGGYFAERPGVQRGGPSGP
jgi:hypothetical protein